jgi:hypothetical protein
MQPSTGYFRSDFVKICDFYIGNAVQFSIRSDPFFEVFRKVRWICMLIGLLSTPILYTIIFSVGFCAEISNFEPKCGPIFNRSIPFNSK